MRDAVICAAVRTPVGKRGGGLSGVHAVDLSAHVLTALAERSGIDPAVVEDAWASWRREVAHAESVYGEADLDALCPHPDGELEVRDVLVHLVEEYARHCGHADLLRECIDGRTGQ